MDIISVPNLLKVWSELKFQNTNKSSLIAGIFSLSLQYHSKILDYFRKHKLLIKENLSLCLIRRILRRFITCG